MKKILQSVGLALTLLVGANANAQLPTHGIYPGGLIIESYVPSSTTALYPIVDRHFKVDSILDAGTPVILDLFATWCGPCWNFHTGAGTWGGVKNLSVLHTNEGGATDNVWIAAVEADPATGFGTLETSGLGNWVTGVPYVMANHNSIASMFNLAYYPTIVMICPDRTVVEVSQTSAANYTTAINGCNGLSSNANDPRLTKNNTTAAITTCGGGTTSTDVKVVVQNYSNAAINASYTFEVLSGATVVATNTVTLNLAAYAAQEVNIGSVNLSVGANNFTARIATANDNLSNDQIAVNVNVSVASDLAIYTGGPNTNEVKIDFQIDGYASELGFAFKEGVPTAGATPASVFSTSNASNSIVKRNTGFLTNGTNAYSETMTVNNLGCHYFVFVDTYGDGITYGCAGCNAKVSGSASTLTIPGNWGAGRFYAVNLIDGGSTVSIDENVATEFSIYPNPASDFTNVKFNLVENSQVEITLINALGQVVHVENYNELVGEQLIQINTSDLENGIYFVNINVNGTNSTSRITVSK